MNPVLFMRVKKLPVNILTLNKKHIRRPENELQEKIKNKVPLEFGHSLESQIGGQIKAGLGINGFYEDISNYEQLDPYIKTFIATLAVKN